MEKKTIKEMIEETLIAKGGVDYLIRQAEENPKTFLTLLKTIIPKDVQLANEPNEPFKISIQGVYDEDEEDS